MLLEDRPIRPVTPLVAVRRVRCGRREPGPLSIFLPFEIGRIHPVAAAFIALCGRNTETEAASEETSMTSARPLIAIFLSALLLLNCLPAAAATIVKAFGKADSVIINISGELLRGDENRFVDIAGTAAGAVVALDSPGGNLVAGIAIGKVIHFKHFDTLVPNGSACASACALAWLGGASRLMGATGRIGFHAPYVRRPGGGIISASPAGNAFVAAYLKELGLSKQAIIYITETPPEKLKWLGFLEARKVGIEVLRAGRPP